SGAAFAVISEPMVLAEPGRLSTMIWYWKRSPSFRFTIRATKSAVPPTGKPTIILTGLCGYACARDAVGRDAAATSEKNTARRIGVMADPQPWDPLTCIVPPSEAIGSDPRMSL